MEIVVSGSEDVVAPTAQHLQFRGNLARKWKLHVLHVKLFCQLDTGTDCVGHMI